MQDTLPTYNQVQTVKKFRGTQYHIFNYGFTNHFWRICSAKTGKAILKYYSVTNHESATLCLGDETHVGSVQRRTLKGQIPRYLAELRLPNDFHSFQDIVFLLDPYPVMDCSDVDGEMLRFRWQRRGSMAKRRVLVRLDQPDKVLAVFRPSILPTKVGTVSFTSAMGDQEICLLLMFLTFTLYEEHMISLM